MTRVQSFGVAVFVVFVMFLLALISDRYHSSAVQAVCGLVLLPGSFLTSKIMPYGPSGGMGFIAVDLLINILLYFLLLCILSIMVKGVRHI
jgi:hypothetical protein